jgi:mannose-6-phosphate isomerase-like protein (cupin superfamily)
LFQGRFVRSDKRFRRFGERTVVLRSDEAGTHHLWIQLPLTQSFRPDNTMTAPANLADKLATFSERFSPRTVAIYNDNDIMVAKLEGPYHWHKHDDTDDFFLVLKGTLDIELRDRTVTLNPGEVFVVPKGVEHRPVARGEVHILLIEPTGTPNSGDKATAAPRILV